MKIENIFVLDPFDYFFIAPFRVSSLVFFVHGSRPVIVACEIYITVTYIICEE